MAQVFHPGDEVMLFYGFADRRRTSIYEVVRALPASAEDERQYQVRGPEGYDRVIGEGQIRIQMKGCEPFEAGEVETRWREPSPTHWRPTRAASVTLARTSGLETQRAAD